MHCYTASFIPWNEIAIKREWKQTGAAKALYF